MESLTGSCHCHGSTENIAIPAPGGEPLLTSLLDRSYRAASRPLCKGWCHLTMLSASRDEEFEEAIPQPYTTTAAGT